VSSENLNIREQIISRIALVYIVLIIFVIYLVVKMVLIITVEKSKWDEKINSIAVELREDEPIRGNIYDENKKILATTVSFFDVHMDTKARGLGDKTFNENIDSLAICLSNFFKDKTPKQYKEKIINARNNSVHYLKIGEHLTYDEFIELKKFPIFRLGSNNGGFISQTTTQRRRPFNDLFRRTIGFLGEDKNTGLVQGKAGLEYTYNRELGGRAGKSYMKKIAGGNWREIKGGKILETENGLDLVTAIDIDLQDYVDDILKEQLSKLKADYGSVVIMETETGYIKAMANVKRYDNETFAEVLNYAVGENLAPGSTFKLPVLMAALEDDCVDLDDIIDTGNGHIMYHGVAVDDAADHSYGKIPVWQVFAKSSNVGMLKIIDDNYVKKGKIKHFLKQLNAIGIGDISGVDIYGENKPMIKTPEHHDWAASTPGMIAHGYEVTISPLQLLTFYNAVANDGVMMKPQIVKYIEKNGLVVKEFKPVVLNPMICSKSTIKKAQKILRDVVEVGTAKSINSSEYNISGKTGTAEHYDTETGTHNETYRASFVGYFPSENPVYSIIVVINKPLTDYYGAYAAAPVFKKIADKLFSKDRRINKPDDFQNVEINTPLSKNGYREDIETVFASLLIPVNKTHNEDWVTTEAQKDVVLLKSQTVNRKTIPDLKYMGAKDAIYLLENMGFKPKIYGRGFVVYQSILPGTTAKKGTEIVLELK